MKQLVWDNVFSFLEGMKKQLVLLPHGERKSCNNGKSWIFTVFVFCCPQVSVTLENFQDISLPIPGKEDLAKLHSSTHQTSLVKAGSCGEAYAPQGWIAFVMEYIKRWALRCIQWSGYYSSLCVALYQALFICLFSQLVLGSSGYATRLPRCFLCQRWTKGWASGCLFA